MPFSEWDICKRRHGTAMFTRKLCTTWSTGTGWRDKWVMTRNGCFGVCLFVCWFAILWKIVTLVGCFAFYVRIFLDPNFVVQWKLDFMAFLEQGIGFFWSYWTSWSLVPENRSRQDRRIYNILASYAKREAELQYYTKRQPSHIENYLPMFHYLIGEECKRLRLPWIRLVGIFCRRTVNVVPFSFNWWIDGRAWPWSPGSWDCG